MAFAPAPAIALALAPALHLALWPLATPALSASAPANQRTGAPAPALELALAHALHPFLYSTLLLLLLLSAPALAQGFAFALPLVPAGRFVRVRGKRLTLQTGVCSVVFSDVSTFRFGIPAMIGWLVAAFSRYILLERKCVSLGVRVSSSMRVHKVGWGDCVFFS